ncbi:MAG: 4-hydroxy-tetrahydrodipicolinate reductase [Fimbriimonadaceae bacterium]|jgi:4-hydroxy-tetrahydrodipicolinate reductase|nr:4-hydroxy-tetrahydrodipicolinate reductase [Fimbriimonadaceae bacterium]
MDERTPIRVAVVGAMGRMGREVLGALTQKEGFDVLVAVDHNEVGRNVRDILGPKAPDLVVEGKTGAALDKTPVDVLVDFSHHSAAAPHAITAMKRGVSAVIGTTGMADEELKEIALTCKDTNVAAIYAPNFAVGAVLMMHFARMAARYMPDAEIIEMHHDKKEDAPSGTAMLTADLIQDGRKEPPHHKHVSLMKVEGVRGGKYHDTPIHSVRLPGLVAHQMVIFGGPGETLTLRHDSLDRSSFMQGVKLCAREVRNLTGLTIGMDNVLFRTAG